MKVRTLSCEVTARCAHRCYYCYNVWKEPDAGVGTGELAVGEWSALLARAVRDSGARHVTITGGEPLARDDALDLLAAAKGVVRSVSLITSGWRLLDAAADIGRLGVSPVQLTFLAAEREAHRVLKGLDSFDDLVEGAIRLREAGAEVHVCFVCTPRTFRRFGEVLELAVALGIRRIAFNRASPAGCGALDPGDVLPTVAQVEEALEVGEWAAARHGLEITTAMPIPRCVVDPSRFPHVRFASCSSASDTPNPVIGPTGEVRLCNLSAEVLADLRVDPWSKVEHAPYRRTFRESVPAECRSCRLRDRCGCGCREAARACRGGLDLLDPFVAQAVAANRPEVPGDVA
ncbi:MAG: radical SAM protein [Deltaproteobacteria bacterium]|nr:radical SAM protein [Deltaproteobacteria bacterium]